MKEGQRRMIKVFGVTIIPVFDKAIVKKNVNVFGLISNCFDYFDHEMLHGTEQHTII